MEKILSIEFYRYLDCENLWCIEMFIHNLKTGAESHRIYKNRDKKKVTAIARAAETKIMNRAHRIYGGSI